MLIERIMPTMSTMFDSYRACQTYHACQSYHVNMPIPCSCTYHADMHAVHVLKYIHAWHVNHAAATNFWTACAIENFNPAQRNSINKTHTHTHNTHNKSMSCCVAQQRRQMAGSFVCLLRQVGNCSHKVFFHPIGLNHGVPPCLGSSL